jgi:membrane-bound metal-dependent hydrolase YbcI (DUF457 family)
MVGMAAAWVGDVGVRRTGLDVTRPRYMLGLHGRAIACGLLAAAPDLDFLVHAHRTYTHSVGATLLVCLAVALWCRAKGQPVLSTTVLCGLAYGSHIPLDWLASSELRSPGVMAFWPWSHEYYKGYGLFGVPEWNLLPLDRFIWKNALYILREQILFVPLIVGAWLIRDGASAARQARKLKRAREARGA